MVWVKRMSTAEDLLWEFDRARYPLACWISTALVIHSFDPIRSLDLFTRLISAGAGNRELEISPTGENHDLEIAPTIGNRPQCFADFMIENYTHV